MQGEHLSSLVNLVGNTFFHMAIDCPFVLVLPNNRQIQPLSPDDDDDDDISLVITQSNLYRINENPSSNKKNENPTAHNNPLFNERSDERERTW